MSYEQAGSDAYVGSWPKDLETFANAYATQCATSNTQRPNNQSVAESGLVSTQSLFVYPNRSEAVAVLLENTRPADGSMEPTGVMACGFGQRRHGGAGQQPKRVDRRESTGALDDIWPEPIAATERRGPVLRFLAQFNDALIYVLLGAAAVTALLGHWIDTQVILAVVLVNAVIGFLQEGKAEKALEAIRDMLAPKANVIRNGDRKREHVNCGR